MHIKVSQRSLEHKFQVERKKIMKTAFLKKNYYTGIYILKMVEKSPPGSRGFGKKCEHFHFDIISLKNSQSMS